MKTIITQEKIKRMKTTAEELDETENIKPIFLEFIYRALKKDLFPESLESITFLDDKCIEYIDGNEKEIPLQDILLMYDSLKEEVFRYGFNMGYTYATVCGAIE